MSYPFVPASAQYGPRKGPVKAFVIHHAEGGGTVGYLSRPNPRNVSVHYVIEGTGRIVQMVKESDASGSINPNDLRTTNDLATFGATVRKAVMGEWDSDPNSAVITVEVEGFAAKGPNVAQRAALVTLVNDVRSRFPSMGLLGHRDYQDYKACPGKLIPWASLGGHGPQETTDMGEYVVPFGAQLPFTITGGTVKSYGATAPYPPLSDLSGTVPVDAAVVLLQAAVPHGPLLRVVTGATGRRLVAAAAGTLGGSDCTDAVDAEHERVRTAAIAAVSAL